MAKFMHKLFNNKLPEMFQIALPKLEMFIIMKQEII